MSIGDNPAMTIAFPSVETPPENLRGRPRNQQTHEAILDAARALLQREGESRFSIEQVAASAGVSKASIYRRWPTKGALLIELYMEGLSDGITQDARSLRVELKRYLLATVERLQDPLWRRILSSLVAEGQYDPVTAQLLRERVVAPRRAAGMALLTHAQQTGQIQPGVDHELVLDLLFGPLWYRLLFEHAPLDADFAIRLLKQIDPILFPKPEKPPGAAKRTKP
jgi:AcrR family transcriptional regulator